MYSLSHPPLTGLALIVLVAALVMAWPADGSSVKGTTLRDAFPVAEAQFAIPRPALPGAPA